MKATRGWLALYIAVVAICAALGWQRPKQRSSSREAASPERQVDHGSVRRTYIRDEPPAESAEVDPALDLVVRDLWDGEVVARAAVVLHGVDGSENSLEADEKGRVSVPFPDFDAIREIRLIGDDVHLASGLKDIEKSKTIWCFRLLEVVGRVAFEGGVHPDFATVSLEYSPISAFGIKEGTRRAGTANWLRAQRPKNWRKLTAPSSPESDGQFRIRVPRIAKAAVVARCPGWFPAWGEIGSPGSQVVLVLRKGISIKGRLVDEKGHPISATRVLVYVIQKTQYDDADLESIGRSKAAGLTASRSKKRDYARIKLSYSAITDSGGRWTVALDGDGEVFVVTYPTGKAAFDRNVGPASRIRDPIEIVVRPADPVPLRIVRGGEAVSNSRLRVVDLSLMNAKPAFEIHTDADGGVKNTDWFTIGKKYGITDYRSRMVFFAYRSEGTLDLAKCESNFDRFVDD